MTTRAIFLLGAWSQGSACSLSQIFLLWSRRKNQRIHLASTQLWSLMHNCCGMRIHRNQSLLHQLHRPSLILLQLLPHSLSLLLQLRRCFPRLWASCRRSSNNIRILMPECSKSTSMSTDVYNTWTLRMMMRWIECFDHSYLTVVLFYKLLFIWATLETL